MAKLTDKEILKAHRKREAAAAAKREATRRMAAKGAAGKFNNRPAYRAALSGKNMTQLPKASIDGRFTTAKKTLDSYRKSMKASKLGYGPKPTLASSYSKTIAKQYPKYIGPTAPYTGLGNKGAIVGNQRAAGRFTKIPEGYLKAMTNQKTLSARSLKVAKGAATAGRIGRSTNIAVLAYEGARALQKGYKRATGPGGRAFHGQFVDYTSKPTNRGKRGVNY